MPIPSDRARSIGWLVQASQRGERRLNAVAVLAGVGALLSLFHC
jgi:hypothetical protein